LSTKIGNTHEALSYAEQSLKLLPQEVSTLYILGNIHTASRQLEKAILAYEKIIQIQVNETDAYFRLAEIYVNKNDLTKAEEVIQKGIVTAPDSFVGYYYLGKIVSLSKRPDEALVPLKEAVRLNPSFEHALMEIAQIYEHQKKWTEAKEIYLHIREEIHPNSSEATRGLIAILIREKSWDEALSLLEELVLQNPSDLNIPMQIALILTEKKEYPKAIEMLLPLSGATPDATPLAYHLAALYEETGEYEKAIATYQKLLKKHNDLYEVHLHLGRLYLHKLKNMDEALAHGEQAMAINAQRPEAYLLNGLMLHNASRYDEAARIFVRGIEKVGGSPDLHFYLGAAYDKLNKFDDLVAEMEKTIQIDAKHAEALNYLGYTYAEKGTHLDEAIDLIQRALAVHPDNGYYVDSLGWAFFKKGMQKEAIDTLERAVVLAPDDPVIHEHLGEAYLRENRMDHVRKAWNRSLRLNPQNSKLISRYKDAGLGVPPLSEPPQHMSHQMQPYPIQPVIRFHQQDTSPGPKAADEV